MADFEIAEDARSSSSLLTDETDGDVGIYAGRVPLAPLPATEVNPE